MQFKKVKPNQSLWHDLFHEEWRPKSQILPRDFCERKQVGAREKAWGSLRLIADAFSVFSFRSKMTMTVEHKPIAQFNYRFMTEQNTKACSTWETAASAKKHRSLMVQDMVAMRISESIQITYTQKSWIHWCVTQVLESMRLWLGWLMTNKAW